MILKPHSIHFTNCVIVNSMQCVKGKKRHNAFLTLNSFDFNILLNFIKLVLKIFNLNS